MITIGSGVMLRGEEVVEVGEEIAELFAIVEPVL
jgi:hypothetical protein